MAETILYGIRRGEEDWQEELLTTDATRIDAATTWAKANGFDRFRVATIDLSVPPDWAKTVNS